MEEPPVSKRKLKKLKRDQEWEANREQRKAKRKEKIKEKKQRKRAAAQGNNNVAPTDSIISTSLSAENPTPSNNNVHKPSEKRHIQPIQLPITIIIDCGFDELMSEKERKSLSAQITRCYSDNQKAPFKAHLAVSSFGGSLKERFDTVLSGQYSSWKGVRFLEADFFEAGQQAKAWMKETAAVAAAAGHSGKELGAFAQTQKLQKEGSDRTPPSTSGAHYQEDQENQSPPAGGGDLIYLTSDSPHTLSVLQPHNTYIIGGLVDRNRHKGICYHRALDRSVKTAKLPIGDYMAMNSRFVLATNHVCEIMLRWMEVGDWGKAFVRVIPKRKGGVLRDGGGKEGREGEGEGGGMGNLDDDEDDDDQNRELDPNEEEDDEEGEGEDEGKHEIPSSNANANANVNRDEISPQQP